MSEICMAFDLDHLITQDLLSFAANGIRVQYVCGIVACHAIAIIIPWFPKSK